MSHIIDSKKKYLTAYKQKIKKKKLDKGKRNKSFAESDRIKLAKYKQNYTNHPSC